MFADSIHTRHEQWQDEAHARWGETEAYRESLRRTATYTPGDWDAINRESDELHAELVATMRNGQPADCSEAVAIAERIRLHMDAWYYPMSRDHHARLAQMYLTDERFTAFYEDKATGLARYLHDAIAANADRSDGS